MKVGLGKSASLAVALALSAFAVTACSRNPAEPEGQGAPEVAPTGGATMPGGCEALALEDGELTIEVGGRIREAIVYVPPQIEPVSLPVVIGLHGYNGTPTLLAEYTRLFEKADESGFIAVLPEGVGSPRGWPLPGLPSTDSEDLEEQLAFFDALIDRLVASGCVDSARIFVAGHSMGGGMAAFLSCQRSDGFAGAALIAAEHLELPCPPSRPIPMLTLHAVDDPILPYAGGEVGGTAPGFPHALPIEAVASAWAEHNGCTGRPTSEELVGEMVRLTWEGCAAPVVHYRLPSGEHRWPGGTAAAGESESPDPDISATDILWDFFAGLTAVS